MKKLLLYALILFAGSQMAKSQVVFDPATFDQTKLKSGMTVVTVNGEKVLKVVLDGWNSQLDIPMVKLTPGQSLKSSYFKYTKSATSTITNPINGVIQVMDTVNKVPASWDPKQIVPSNTGIGLYPVSNSVGAVSGAINEKMKLIHQIQFFGQEQGGSWGPTTGDTIWVGKVRAVTLDNKVLFDPKEADPSLLSAGQTIVEINGEKYLQAILAGWNSSVTIVDSFNITAAATDFTCKVKYAVGTSGQALTNINTFLKLANNTFSLEFAAAGSASSATFAEYSVPIAKTGKVAKFQFAGQEKTNWSAVSGDTIWIGKVALKDGTNPAAPATLTGAVDVSKVTLTWAAATDNDGIKEYIIKKGNDAIDTVTATTLVLNNVAQGTYTFSVIAVDKSGNKSAAKTAEVTVGPAAAVVTVNNELGIYPNPAHSEINVLKAGQNILIIDATGKTVMNIKNSDVNAVINVNSLKSGLYIIKNINNGIATTSTFIKK